MVETRSRRKSTAPSADDMGSSGEAAAPPTNRRAAAQRGSAQPPPEQQEDQQRLDYAEVYREKARRAKQAEQSNILRRLTGHAQLMYHQQAMTWGWYMLEPWETLLWMAILLVLLYFVLSACFLNPDSVCRAGLASARRTLAAQGAKLLAYRQ